MQLVVNLCFGVNRFPVNSIFVFAISRRLRQFLSKVQKKRHQKKGLNIIYLLWSRQGVEQTYSREATRRTPCYQPDISRIHPPTGSTAFSQIEMLWQYWCLQQIERTQTYVLSQKCHELVNYYMRTSFCKMGEYRKMQNWGWEKSWQLPQFLTCDHFDSCFK